MRTTDACRKHGVSSSTFYAWKARCGGMDVSQARKLKVLEEENARLKRLLADAMLDDAVHGGKLVVAGGDASEIRRAAEGVLCEERTESLRSERPG